ncbi:KDEL motif-containing protein 1 [Porphyridium purpureum]|uniref:KDEL motif-containing protein 1 n=1 Tax=Porphyridium purpureum TaxID=35688 RepID=A0A5J4YWQ6_PORPP|nr:KDEL motif-containing protein 1 [Porphyridium purpureum]|eukprot:POR0310..scf209_3
MGRSKKGGSRRQVEIDESPASDDEGWSGTASESGCSERAHTDGASSSEEEYVRTRKGGKYSGVHSRHAGAARGSASSAQRGSKRGRARGRSAVLDWTELRERAVFILRVLLKWIAGIRASMEPRLYKLKALLPSTSQGYIWLLLFVVFAFYTVGLIGIMFRPQTRSSGNYARSSAPLALRSNSSIPREAPPVPPLPTSPVLPESLGAAEGHAPPASDAGVTSAAHLFKTAKEAIEALANETVGFRHHPSIRERSSALSEEEMALVEEAMAKLSPFSRLREDLMVPADVSTFTKEDVQAAYAKLAKAYLKPFQAGIRRATLFDILKRRNYNLAPPGAAKGVQSVLIQLINKQVFVLDPYEIQASSDKPFQISRLKELVWIVKRLADEGRMKDTEFLVALHDCVQTVNEPHNYRVPTYKESAPVFTIVGCNFSDNIPLPMWEGGERVGYQSWDSQMEEYQQDTIDWDSKLSQAVFRGGLRSSAFFEKKRDAELRCEEAGRSRLHFLSRLFPDLFDVSVGGNCRSDHFTLKTLAPRDHHQFKYVTYMEGNCFWADRLNRQLFGPSAILKQETPCGQFYEPLLRPHAHYLPTDYFLTDTVYAVEWAQRNDKHMREMVSNAKALAAKFLTLKGIETYFEQLFEHYTGLLMEKTIVQEFGAEEKLGQ